VTMTSPPLAVGQATINGTVNLPSLERAAELRASGDLHLSGLRWVGDARIEPEGLNVPSLREAGSLRIATPGRRPITRGDAEVNLPSLVSVGDLSIDTGGTVRAVALRTAGSIDLTAPHAEFPRLEDSGLGLLYDLLPGSAGLFELPSLQYVEWLWVRAHEPSTVRAPVLTEVVELELRNTTPEMVALERADDVLIRGANDFELPALRRVGEFSLVDVTSSRPLEFAFGGLTADRIPWVDIGTTRAPAFRLLGTSLVEVFIDRSEIPEVAFPNAPAINGVTLSESEVDRLLFSAPPSAYWIHVLDVVGITQCECEQLAPYVIDDGYEGPRGDHRCEGLAACE